MDNNIYILAANSQHQKTYGDAIECALNSYNIKCVRINNSWLLPHTARFICTWGWRRGPKLRDAGKQVLVMERGFIDRMNYGSIMLNGLNGLADFGNVKIDPTRFDKFKDKFKPWQGDRNFLNKKPVLILGQTPNDCSLRGQNLDPWYQKMAKDIKEKFDLPVVFRPHPNVVQRGATVNYPNMHIDKETPLNELLDNSSFAVTFNSNSAVDCLLNGTQVVVHDQGSMAFGICPNTLNDINFIEPDRLKFFESLCSKQFTPEEISQGKGIEHFVQNFTDLMK